MFVAVVAQGGYRVEQWGREQGAVVVMCDTWLGSPVSLPFWEERMGYSRRAVTLEKPL